jgi:glucokinase-like ROK family protein
MLLTLDPAAGFIISGEIGVDFISVICTSFSPDIIWRHKEKINPEMGQRKIIDRALAILSQAVDAGKETSPNFLGLAIGVPGLVDLETGTLLFAPNLGWENTPLRQIMQETFNTAIFVDNEANLAALGETYFGAAQGYREVLYVSAGVGLGGGIVHSGQVCRGGTGIAGEVGHITMDPEGELCNGGNRGCWETQVSQRTLFKYVRDRIESGQSSLLSERVSADLNLLTVRLINDAAREGDIVAIQALKTVGSHLGTGIASLINALNPELVVFGGILSLASDTLLPCIQEEVNRRSLKWSAMATKIVTARHGSDACVMGGVAMVYQAILAQPDSMVRPTSWNGPTQSSESNIVPLNY